MIDRIDRFMEGPNCGDWPRWLRRTFLLTAPISFPLYGLAVITVFIFFLVRLLIEDLPPVAWLKRTWR